jgi:hypothetical protein
MSTKRRTLAEIRVAGLEILARELGPADFVRFLQQFEPGRGDYTAERHRWLDHLDADTILQMIQERRQRGKDPSQNDSE